MNGLQAYASTEGARRPLAAVATAFLMAAMVAFALAVGALGPTPAAAWADEAASASAAQVESQGAATADDASDEAAADGAASDEAAAAQDAASDEAAAEGEEIEDDETPMSDGLGGAEPIFGDGFGLGKIALIGIAIVAVIYVVLTRRLNSNISDMRKTFR